MTDRSPWSVKGIDQRARAAARDAARMEGVTLGEYLNKLILEESRDDYPNEVRHAPIGRRGEVADSLDHLARRVEAVEARSTLAITGMDQSVLGLLARLEKSENNQSIIAGHVDDFIDELRETHEALAEKVRQLEQDDANDRNLEALRALEDALGKLAAHVYEEGERQQVEGDAIRGRVEAGFSDLGERMEAVETRVESRLSDAARRIDAAVEAAAQKVSKDVDGLAGRLDGIEARIEDEASHAHKADLRLDRVEEDVSGALGSMENTLIRIQDRLNRAETTTDAALKSLESTFSSLDARITKVAETAGPEAVARLRGDLEGRFHALAGEMKAEIDTVRGEMAARIAKIAEIADPARIDALQDTIDRVQDKVVASDARNAEAFRHVGAKVSELASGIDERINTVEAGAASTEVVARIEEINAKVEERLEAIDTREASIIETVGTEVGKLADRIDNRVSASEAASARAIEQIGEQVATVAKRLQGRQDEAFGRLSAHVETSRSKQEARLSDALASMTERFERIQSATQTQVSPVQQAIASLAARLETLESRAPLASDTAQGEDELLAAFSRKPDKASADDVFLPIGDAAGEDDFQPGLPEWGADAASEEEDLPDEDYTPSATAAPKAAFSDTAPNPLEMLVNDWTAQEDTGGDEVRDSDVFDDFPPVAEPKQARGLDLDEVKPASTSPAARLPEVPELTAGLEEDLDAGNYIARARRAALAASAESERSSGMSIRSQGRGRAPLYAAASVVILAAAGAGGYLVLRGKQSAPDAPQSAVASAPAIPVTAAAPAEAEEPAVEQAEVVEEAVIETTAALPEPEIVAASLQPVAPVAEPVPQTPPPAATPQPPAATPVAAPPTPRAIATASFPPIPAAMSLEAAADSGDRIAQYEFGIERLNASDYARGAELIREAANQGLPVAQYRLSKLHENGLGVARDLAAARSWTERAARGGNVRAMHDLAVFFADGEGGTQSYASAAEWFGRAAGFGVLDSQYNLGVLYERGLGLTEDPAEALFWFKVAELGGDAGATERVAELSANLPVETVRAVLARAASWEASQPVRAANGEFGPQAWEGGRGERVLAVQVALVAVGFDLGTPDGVMGPSTASAIRAYQRAEGLEVTGTISEEVVRSLNARAASS